MAMISTVHEQPVGSSFQTQHMNGTCSSWGEVHAGVAPGHSGVQGPTGLQGPQPYHHQYSMHASHASEPELQGSGNSVQFHRRSQGGGGQAATHGVATGSHGSVTLSDQRPERSAASSAPAPASRSRDPNKEGSSIQGHTSVQAEALKGVRNALHPSASVSASSAVSDAPFSAGLPPGAAVAGAGMPLHEVDLEGADVESWAEEEGRKDLGGNLPNTTRFWGRFRGALKTGARKTGAPVAEGDEGDEVGGASSGFGACLLLCRHTHLYFRTVS